MKPADGCPLVFFMFLFHVQCQWVRFVEGDSGKDSFTVGKTPPEAGSFYDSASSPRALAQQASFHPGQNGNRARRQAYGSSSNGGGPYSWSHFFTIPPVYSSTKESAYVREENMKRLKNMLEKETQFQFLNPSGLRISFPADNTNVRIMDLRFKVNEEFRANDGGHYAPMSYRRGDLLTYEVPEIQVRQGDKVYYWMSVKFVKEGTDVIVNGLLEVTRGNPHVGGGVSETIPFRPTGPIARPPQPGYGGALNPTLGGGYGGTGGVFVWDHQFTINATYGSGFTQSSADNWLQQAELLKNNVQNIDFQFKNPTGLTVLIPDNNLNTVYEDFRLKLNEEFRGNNDGGHFAPSGFKRGNFLTYSVPQLAVGRGDRVFYSVRARLGAEQFNVRGVLSISQGGPPKGSNGIQSGPTYPRPSPSVGGGLGGNVGGNPGGPLAVRWEHRFTINTTYDSAFNQESADRWFDEAKLFKNTLEKDIEFQFLNPTGLSISISGDNEDVKILSFNLKLNEEFRTLTQGNFMANATRLRDGRWNYYYPDLKLKQGDKVFYWMRVTLGKQAFDNIVKGVLEVKQGDPHLGGPVSPLKIPDKPTNQYPNQYPNQPTDQYPSRYPQTTPPNRYPQTTPPNRYPQTTPPNRYPQTTPLNRYPQTTPPNRYPQTTPPNLYPQTTPPSQYPQPSVPEYPPPPPPEYPSLPSPSQPTVCGPSVTSATRNGDTTPPCQGEVLMEHKFNTLDGWTHQISIGGKNPEDEFTCFTKYEENAWVQQGRLNIQPTLLEERANDSYVRGGELFLPGCTLSDLGSKFCHRKAQGYTILPPVNSARITTQSMFTFRYGIVEIRAKLPQGDWIVPELWLEPTNPSVEEKIVAGVTTGNAGKTANQVAAGVVRASDKRLTLMTLAGASPWYRGYHTFRLEWTPDNVKFFVDNRQIHDLPSRSFTVFSQEVFISLGVHAGGYRDFPDDSYPDKPWKDFDVKRIARFWDAKKTWYPSWKTDPVLQVASIRVTAL